SQPRQTDPAPGPAARWFGVRRVRIARALLELRACDERADVSPRASVKTSPGRTGDWHVQQAATSSGQPPTIPTPALLQQALHKARALRFGVAPIVPRRREGQAPQLSNTKTRQ